MAAFLGSEFLLIFARISLELARTTRWPTPGLRTHTIAPYFTLTVVATVGFADTVAQPTA